MDRSNVYLWFDLEFTTPDLDEAEILQAALLITDEKLERITEAPGLDLIVELDPAAELSPWVQQHLGPLLERCRAAGRPLAEVDAALAAFVDAAVGPPTAHHGQRPILAGNSIHADWHLVRKHLPELTARVNYRLLDVSALKLQWKHHLGGARFDKDSTANLRRYFPAADVSDDPARHDAWYDVQASLAELAFYRAHWERPPSTAPSETPATDGSGVQEDGDGRADP